MPGLQEHTSSLSGMRLAIGFVLCVLAAFGAVLGQFNQVIEADSLRDGDKRLLLRSENAFYYRFYEDLVNATSLLAELKQFRHRTDIESNRTVNVIQRFNLTQEIVLASIYRILRPLLPQDPIGFYIHSVLLLNSLLAGVLYLWSTRLSGSIWIGFAVPFFYIANLFEITRAFNDPGLRETAGIVWTLLSFYLLYCLVDGGAPASRATMYCFGCAVLLRSLFWQFSQVVLYVEILLLNALYLWELANFEDIKRVAVVLLVASALALLLQQGNLFYLTSLPFLLLASFLGTVLIGAGKSKWARLGIMIVTAVGLKLIANWACGEQSDSHIFAFLRFKAFGQESFNGLLYARESAFQTLNWRYWVYMSESFVLPLAILATAFVGLELRKNPSFSAGKIWLLLALAFGLGLAIMARRFVVFLSPMLIVLAVSGVAILRARFPTCTPAWLAIPAVVVLTFLNPARHHVQVNNSLGAQELQLIDYINEKLSRSDVIYGPINRSGEIQLLTRHTTVIHPHYEDQEIQRRTRDYHSLYADSRPSRLKNLQEQYGFSHLLIAKDERAVRLAQLALGKTTSASEQSIHEPSEARETLLEAVFENELFVLYAVRRDED